MESIKFLVTATLISLLCGVAAFQVREDTTADSSDGPLGLAEATNQALVYLGEARTGAEAKVVLQDLVDRATVLLEGSGGGSSQPEEEVVEIANTDDIFKVAQILDLQFLELHRYADKLTEAVGSGDTDGVRKNVLAIKLTASAIIKQIDDEEIDVIVYNNSNEDVNDVERPTKRGVCIGIGLWGGCVGIHLGKRSLS